MVVGGIGLREQADPSMAIRIFTVHNVMICLNYKELTPLGLMYLATLLRDIVAVCYSYQLFISCHDGCSW